MKVEVAKDGRIAIPCPDCGEIIRPHIPNARKPKTVDCWRCGGKFVFQGQYRKCAEERRLVWVRRKDLEENIVRNTKCPINAYWKQKSQGHRRNKGEG